MPPPMLTTPTNFLRKLMGANENAQLNLVERRRLQNRLAQRKFREKKRLAEGSVQVDATLGRNGSFQSSPMDSAAGNDEVVAVSAVMPLSAEHLTDEPELENTHIELDTIDQLMYQTNNNIFLPSLNPPALQQPLEHSTPQKMTSWDLMSWNTPQSSTANNEPFQLHDSQIYGTRPHRRASESDMPSSMPAHSLAPSHNNDFSRLITTSKKTGWVGSLHIAAQRGHEQILRVLILRSDMDVNEQDSDGRTPLIHAVIEDHESIVRLLLEQGARIGIFECDDRSAIHWAVLRRNVRILVLLLNHRLEHEPSLVIDTYDKTGWTPLHMAIERGFEPGMVLLLQMGADINAKAHKCPYAGNVIGLLDRSKKP
ncbi:ankyrin repeat-containing domain protein [Talaromyces proteolyticus]|uniref:Ankyrin repeat-containing domain protein n=1 Tax=Talaromyces proteolyticus TaxID=1131652 RepID=A0AAD4KKV7_9EURO|nr:ankyrin repeat-containing domain protein [Talaromyces proteolyticus]KAH8690748.1 ankyrin repeat-containing domain protein [Talaromyces proteolyticus]